MWNSITKGLDVGYFTTFSENTEKYMTYTNTQGKEIQVIYAKDENSDADEFKYMAREKCIILYKSNIVNMLDYVEQTISNN